MSQHQEFLTVLHLSRSIGQKIDSGLRSNGIHFFFKNFKGFPKSEGSQCQPVQKQGNSIKKGNARFWTTAGLGSLQTPSNSPNLLNKTSGNLSWASSGLAGRPSGCRLLALQSLQNLPRDALDCPQLWHT